MPTHTLATKDPNHASARPHNIKANIPGTNDVAQITYPFEDDRLWIVDNSIQEQKPASTKNRKVTRDHGLILYTMASHDE